MFTTSSRSKVFRFMSHRVVMSGKVLIILVLINILDFVHCGERPNIVIILADDLGYNDASFHGSSEIPTPNLDVLCYSGVILNRMYTTPLCTPSRSSLMTGKYSTKLGMQHYVIPSDEPWGLPIHEKIIPEYFKEAGYKTALVGKWHLGFFEKAYTPLMRGFDSHYGYLGPYIGYYDHSLIMLDRNYSRGFDMRRNWKVEDASGKYATDLFTDEAVNLIKSHNASSNPLFLLLSHLAPHAGNEDKPLEAPEGVVNEFAYIENEKRRMLAAMIKSMDDGIGRVVEALNEKNLMNNTIIMFLSDNGGPTYGIHSTAASNYPLRGQKGSIWEGGTRVPACMYSPLINSKRRVTNEFMHITDILPTMAAAANISIGRKIDGVSQWKMITNKNTVTERKDILYNIESVFGFSAIMSEGWKLVNGSENINFSHWFGSSGDYAATSVEVYYQMLLNSTAFKNLPALASSTVMKLRNEASTFCGNTTRTVCNPMIAPCLFDIVNDPCEMNNLATEYPESVKGLMEKLQLEIQAMLPSVRQRADPMCDPRLHNSTWTWWRGDNDKKSERSNESDYSSRNLFLLVLFLIFVLTQVIIFSVKCRRGSRKFENLNRQ